MEIVHLKTLWWIGGTIILTIYLYLKFIVYNYWKRKGLPHDTPNILAGNSLPIVLREMSLGDTLKNSYEKYKNHRFHGFYMFCQPLLIINDPDLIRLVLVKEFKIFHDHDDVYVDETVDPLAGHLFHLQGEKWKRIRNKLSPAFTSGKLKQIFPLLQDICGKLLKACDRMVNESTIIDVNDLFRRYTIDSICSIAFGFNCNSIDHPEHEFKRRGYEIFSQHPIRNALRWFTPSLQNKLKISSRSRSLTRFIIHTFEEMIKYRQEKKVVRNDILNMLMQLMDTGVLNDDESFKHNDLNSVPSNEKITMNEAVAQAYLFFAGGFETSASTATYCLYELSLNPEIQETVQAEIDVFLKSEDVTYDRIMNEVVYLHMVFSETLRKHPNAPFLMRYCNKDFDIPNSHFRIEKGTTVVIPVSGLHSDSNIYPDSRKFNPSRFSKENVAARSPYAYLPFGEGPRNCIGMRLAILEIKMALITLLSTFKFSVCDKTPIPLHYSKRSAASIPEEAVYLKLERRN